MLEIVINNIQHEYLDDEFSQLKVSYNVYKDGKSVKRSARYIDEDLSYQEIKDSIKGKEEEKPIRTFSDALISESEIESVKEIQQEEEEL